MTLGELKQKGGESLSEEKRLLKELTISKINNDKERTNTLLEEYCKKYNETNDYVFTFFKKGYRLPVICFQEFEHLIEECQDFNEAMEDMDRASIFGYPLNYLSFAHNYNTDKEYLDLMFDYTKNNNIDNLEQFVENIYTFTPEIVPYRNYFANSNLDLSLDSRKLSNNDKIFLFELIKIQLIHAFYKSNMNLLIGVHKKDGLANLENNCILSLTLFTANLINQCHSYKIDNIMPYWYEYLKMMLKDMVLTERQNTDKNVYLGEYALVYDRYDSVFDEALKIIDNKKPLTKKRTSKE